MAKNMTELQKIADAVESLAGGGSGGGGSSTLVGLTDVDISNPTDGQTLTYDATAGKWVNGGGSTGGVMYVHMAVTVDAGELVVQVEEQIEDIIAAIRAGKLLVADVNSDNILSASWRQYFYLKNADISTAHDEYIEFEDIVFSTTTDKPTDGGSIDMARITYEGSGEEGVDGYWGLKDYRLAVPAKN